MSVMHLNVARKVRHYRLSKSRAYVAIFEAISNSIDAIKERDTPGSIFVTFKRDTSQANLLPDIEDIGLLKEVTVTDDGIGFNDENYLSFLESDTARKEQLGGRGLGRFSWLKVFEKVEIISHFVTDGKGHKRTFTLKGRLTEFPIHP
jgi:anti-sigma regulatory factor (Ser/Thr protein kinase)